jgi:predicted metalloprotease with PDZ domain
MKNVGIIFWVLFCWVIVPAIDGQVRFDYTVSITNPAVKKAYVTLHIQNISENDLTFLLPAWAPGNYAICHFGRWIDSVLAYDGGGQPLRVLRKNVDEWQIKNARHIAKITYIARDIPEDSLESLPTSLNEMGSDYFFFNGPSVFGYLKNHTREKCRVTYQLPANWIVACSLDSVDSLTFAAHDYDELIDCPVIAGGPRIKIIDFEVQNGRYTMVINSESDVKLDTLTACTKQIVEYETNLFGETPFRKYVFLFNFFTNGQRFGALEHANSSAYYLPPPIHESEIRNSFYARVIAHEFFHLWNPKRIHPAALDEFDYQDSIKIASMWFIEGVTEYYAKLTLVRTGIWPASYFYNDMRNIAQADIRDDLESLSYESARTGVAASMYTKGALVAFLMDIETRDRTNNAKSLDDVILYMNKQWAHKNKNYNDGKLITIFKDATGVDLQDLYKKYIAGKDSLSVQSHFTKVGLNYEMMYPPFLGWNLDIDDDNQLFVSSFADHSTATDVGLQSGDIVKEIGSVKLTTDADQIRHVVQSLDSLKVGNTIRFKVSRSGQVLELSGKIKAASQADVTISENRNASPKQKMLRNGILGNAK